MAKVLKRVKIANPGKRKLSLKQKLFFGSKRQRNAAKISLKRKKKNPSLVKRFKSLKARLVGNRKKQYNPSEIITIGLNPGRKKRKVTNIMAKRKVRRMVHKTGRMRMSNSTRVVKVYNPRRKRRNPLRYAGKIRRKTYKYVNPRRRRRNGVVATRRRSYRRNPGVFSGFLGNTFGTALGVIGGAALTKMIMDRLPASLNTGFMKYLSTGVVAGILGFGVGKVAKSQNIGASVALGGYTLLGLQLLTDYVPGFAGYSALGLRGMGLIGPSSFYTPQVPTGAGFNQFVPPTALTAAIPVNTGMKGMGRMGGRTRFGRVA